MKSIKLIDEIGRVHIPTDLRRVCDWRPNETLEVSLGDDGESLILRKYTLDEGDTP